MNKPLICKHCRFIIIIGGNYHDQKAQERGFCKDICRILYEEERNFVMEREAAR